MGNDHNDNLNDDNNIENNDLKLGWATMEVTGSSME